MNPFAISSITFNPCSTLHNAQSLSTTSCSYYQNGIKVQPNLQATCLKFCAKLRGVVTKFQVCSLQVLEQFENFQNFGLTLNPFNKMSTWQQSDWALCKVLQELNVILEIAHGFMYAYKQDCCFTFQFIIYTVLNLFNEVQSYILFLYIVVRIVFLHVNY